MKKSYIIILVLLVVFIGSTIFGLGKVRTDVVLKDYHVSDDGSEITLKIIISSSAGYVRKLEQKNDGDNCYIKFYQTLGINSKIGAKDEYKININSNISKIYFMRENNEYQLVLEKDGDYQEWVMVNTSDNKMLK